MFVHFVFLFHLQAKPIYTFDIQTKELKIGPCENENEFCEINRVDYQKSGPYITYKKVSVDLGPTAIINDAFSDSQALEEIYISSWVNNISTPFCKNCYNLKTINITSPSKYYETDSYGNLYSKVQKSLVRSPTKLSRIEIKEDTEMIAFHALFESQITSLSIPKNVKTIESLSMYAARIQTLKFAEDSKIEFLGKEALYHLPYLINIEFPSNLRGLDISSISDCKNLKNVFFPKDSHILTIGVEAFKGDTALTSIRLPGSVETISASAFASCSSLKVIELSLNLSSLDSSAFSGCGSISSISIPEGNQKYTVINNSLYTKALDSVIIIPTSIETFDVPNELTSIGQTALQLCPNLTMLNIGQKHQKYMKHEKMLIDKTTKTVLGFVGGIEEVSIPEGVTSLGPYCGYKCRKLAAVELPKSVTSVGDFCFSLSSIASISAPSVTSFGASAFESCNSLVDITFIESESSSISFSTGTFIDCSSISSLHFKCSVSNIPYRFCRGCGAKSVIFERNGFTSTSQGSFEYMKRLEFISFPKSLNFIDRYTFQSSAIQTIKFPNGCGVQTVSSLSFTYCQNLRNITFESSLKRMDSSAFLSCKSLKQIIISDECPITELSATDLFKDCKSLETFNVPANVQKVEPSMFSGCSSLRSVTANGSSVFTSENGILYDTRNSQKILIVCPPGIGEAEIGESVTALGVRCFYGCVLLSTVDFPKSTMFREIGDSVFFGCSGLKKIKIPKKVQNISGTAFSGCNNLLEVEFDPESDLSALGSGVFSGCISLTKINLNCCNKLESVPDKCFKGCSIISKLQLPKSTKSIGESAFEGCLKMNSITLPEALKDIHNYCFRGSGLKGIFVLPKAVRSVGKGSFSECLSLRHIVHCGTQALSEDALDVSKISVHVTNTYPDIECLGAIPIRDASPECYIATSAPVRIYDVAVFAVNIVTGGVSAPSDDE